VKVEHVVLWCALIAGGVGGAVWFSSRSAPVQPGAPSAGPTPAEATQPDERAQQAPAATQPADATAPAPKPQAEPAPVPRLQKDGKNLLSALAPGRYPMSVPFSNQGIPCGDGRYLPLLNGMDSAPPIQGNLGPVQPIVAKIIDAAGTEWWEHADGSVTTSRWEHVTVLDEKTGKSRSYWDRGTAHNARVPDSWVQKGPPVDPGGAKDPGR
jgi:hypothetical protein